MHSAAALAPTVRLGARLTVLALVFPILTTCDGATRPNQPPAATITAPSRDTTVLVGDTVSFAGTGADPDGTVTGYSWNLGDGNVAAEQTIRHAFLVPGTDTVLLHVTDDHGADSPADTVLVTAVTVKIDGVLSPGEWDGALEILVRDSGEYAGTTLWVMNDGDSLYFAMKVPQLTTLAGSRVEVRFDNANNGVLDPHEDEFAAYPAPHGYADLYAEESSEGIFWNSQDTQQDGSSATTSDGTWRVFEAAHPLASGDPYDLSLSYGAVVGFCATYYTGLIYVDYPDRCITAGSDLSGYAKLTVNPAPSAGILGPTSPAASVARYPRN